MELKSHSCWPNIAAVTMFLFLVGLIMSCSDSDSDSDNEANNEANNSSEGDCVTDEDCQANFDGHPQIENINKFTCRTDGQGIRFCSECESSDECESGVCTGKTFCGLLD